MVDQTATVQAKNLAVIGGALVRIRSLAREGQSSDAAAALREIEEIADRLHNVPKMMVIGTSCDAEHLLMVGIDESWPTGISAVARPL